VDKLSSLRAFAKVVEHGSFSEAARALRLSRSAVSKYVIELEQALGVSLLNRTTRSAVPTENGRAYYESVVPILAEIEEADLAVTRLQSEPRGLLRLNAPMSFGTRHLGPALVDFMQAYPQMQVQLTLSDEQIDAVQEGFDVTLRIAELASSSLIARRLIGIERAFCASPAYLERRGVPEHPKDLKDHDCLTYGFLATGNQWKLIGPDGEHWLTVPWRMCANNAEVLEAAAVGGHGIALLPMFLAEAALASGALRRVLEGYRAPEIALHAIYPPTRHLSLKVRLLIDFLVARFKGREWASAAAPVEAPADPVALS
jgi:DNA-binding transcriptional LysR family regulator